MRNLIGRNVRFIRVSKGLSQLELSARLETLGINIDRPMISKIENSQREVNDFEILGFSLALEVDILELFREVGL